MSGRATLVINADTKDGQLQMKHLTAHMEKQQAEIKKLQEANRKAAEEAKKRFKEQEEAHRKQLQGIKEKGKAEKDAAKEAEKANKEAAAAAKKKADEESKFNRQLLTVVGTYVSLDMILGKINEKHQRQIQLQSKIGRMSSNIANAQLDLLGNSGNLTPEQQRSLHDAVVRANAESGFGDMAAFLRSAAVVASVTGADESKLVPAMREAGRFSPGREDEMMEMAAASAKIGLQTGEDDPRKALGLMLTILPNSDIREVAKVAQNLPAVIEAAMANTQTGTPDDTARDAASLFAYLTGAGDKDGNSSRTAAIKMTKAMADFFPEGQDPGNFQGRLAAIQAGGPKMQEEFLKGAGAEALFKTRIEGLVRGDEKSMDIYRGGREGIKFDADKFEEQVALRHSMTPQLQTNSRLAQMRAQASAASLAQSDQARVDAARQIYQEIIDNADSSGSTGMFDSMTRGFAMIPAGLQGPETNIAMMQKESQSLLHRMAGGTIDTMQPDQQERQLQSMSPDMRELVKATMEMVELLKGLRGDVRENTKPRVRPQGDQEDN